MQTQVEVYRDDKKYVRTWLNERIRPILYNLGYAVADGNFKAEKETNLSEVADKLAIFQQVKTLGEPIDADTIYETAGITKPANYDAMKKDQADKEAAKAQVQNNNFPPKKDKQKSDKTKKLMAYDDDGFWFKLRSSIADFFAPAR